MIQTVLVITVIAAAVLFLGFLMYKKFFSKNEACEGCAVSKMHEWK